MSDARLSGRTALVTGAGSGIGAAVARRLAAEGAKVILADVALDAVERSPRELGPRPAPCSSTSATRSRWRRRWPRLDVLVNVAGIGSTTNAPDTPLEVWENVFAVNARGTFLCCKHAIPGMAARGGGSIVNMASVGGSRRAAQPRRLLRLEGRRRRADARARGRPRRRRDPRQRRLPRHRRLAVGTAPRRGGRRVARRAARPAADGAARARPTRSPRRSSTCV